MPYNTTGIARRLHQGHKSALNDVKPHLKAFIFKIYEQGVQVMNEMVECESSRLLQSFKNKLPCSKELCVVHFMRSLGLTQHTATHTAQKHFNEMTGDATDFIDMMHQKLAGCNLDNVLNMDVCAMCVVYLSKKVHDSANNWSFGEENIWVCSC